MLVLVIGAYCMTRALEDGRSAGGCYSPFAARRPRLPHQDAPGRAGAARRSASSTCVAAPTGLRRRLWQLAVADRRVRRRRSAGGSPIVELRAGLGPAVHRRLAGQQRAQPDLRLQRLRPAHRQRDRQRRRRRQQRRLGRDRLAAAVQQRVRRPGVVAAAGRARPARRRPRRSRCAPSAPTGPAPRCSCGAAGCSSPAPPSASVEGHHPPVLHGRPRPGDRRAGRHRRRSRCGVRDTTSPPASGSPRRRASRVVDVQLLQRTPGWNSVAAAARDRRRRGRRRRRPAADHIGRGVRWPRVAPASSPGWPRPRRRRSHDRGARPHTGAIPSGRPGGGAGGFGGPAVGGGLRRRPRAAGFGRGGPAPTGRTGAAAADGTPTGGAARPAAGGGGGIGGHARRPARRAPS